MRVLLVEDEPKLASLLKRGLGEHGFSVDHVDMGGDAVLAASDGTYDAIILDLTLPDIDGLEVCRRLRDDDVWTPVLMLTARDAIDDRVGGLDAGADDYLVKPFSFLELLARLRALARREPRGKPTVLVSGGLTLDPAKREVRRDGQLIELSKTEYLLLEAFMRRPGQTLDRQTLLDLAWDGGHGTESNVVNVYVRYLREKIDLPFGTDSIRTVRGVGYRWNVVDSDRA